MPSPKIVRTVKALRSALDTWRRKGKTVALVPTMGALHEGHLSLVRLAHKRADKVVATIFVNPAQFAPHEDYGRYPRTWKADIRLLREEKTDLVFAPSVKEMYPKGFTTRLGLEGPALGLETDFRPHFFGGVATVVSKLLIQAMADVAIFGEKDYQQLLVIRRMARDLDIPTKIVGAPIVREKDGLALSSRNIYLSLGERLASPTLYKVLSESAAAIKRGEAIEPVLARGRTKIEEAGFKLDYLEARNADTLAKPSGNEPLRLLVAARIGGTRLIDNVGVKRA
jgi:pantoate--beta-alanine ligase